MAQAQTHHRDLDPRNRHGPHSWVVPNAAHRNLLAVTWQDLGKYCWQQNDDTEWMLTHVSPTVWALRSVRPEESTLYEYTAGENLSGHVAVTLGSDGLAYRANCLTYSHAASVVGVTVAASVIGAPSKIRSGGLLVNPGWGLTPESPIYLGELGALVHSLPPSALFSKQLGVAVSSSSVVIELQPAIFLSN